VLELVLVLGQELVLVLVQELVLVLVLERRRISFC
jgi:hypothetical protein